MLAEFALEPRLLHNWDRFQRLIALFGLSQGRLISRFPKKWKEMVLAAVTCPPVEKAKIEEALRRRLDDRLFPRHHNWLDDFSWLENAVAEHGIRPFHDVLAASTVSGLSFCKRRPRSAALAGREVWRRFSGCPFETAPASCPNLLPQLSEESAGPRRRPFGPGPCRRWASRRR